MFSKPQIRRYQILFLIFCVASSKSIIIYNEETLVALSFFSFVIFCFHYFGNTVTDSLNSTSLTIKSELENFHQLKSLSLHELIESHQRISKLSQILPTIVKFTQQQLKTSGKQQHTSKSQAAKQIYLNNRFLSKIQQKLAQLKLDKSLLTQHLQKVIAANVHSLVGLSLLFDIQENKTQTPKSYLKQVIQAHPK